MCTDVRSIRSHLMFQFQNTVDRNGFNPYDDEGRKSKVKYLVLSLNAFSGADNFVFTTQWEQESETV